MSRRRHPCDVCGHERRRWQRICHGCWDRLPRGIRTAILEAWQQGKRTEWRAARRESAAFLARAVARDTTRFQATLAARLGERLD